MDIRTALASAQKKLKDSGITSASLDAEVLLLEAVDPGHGDNRRDKSWLYLNAKTYGLSTSEQARLDTMIERRARHEPVAYILNRKEFYGLDFYVDKNVLIPRPETELIVEEALSLIRSAKRRLVFMDIGTGSGCIPISVLKNIRGTAQIDKLESVLADDISAAALRVARKNAKRHDVGDMIGFLHLDLGQALEILPRDSAVIITANLPYVKEENHSHLSADVRDFEPKIALTAADHGMSDIRRLIEKFAMLRSAFISYALLLEADPKQMRSMASIAKRYLPECDTEIRKDIRGKKRMMKISSAPTK